MTHVWWHLRSIRWWQFLLAPLLFGLLGWHNVLRLDHVASTTIWDAWVVALAGPSLDGFDLASLTYWLMPYLLFFYLIGNVPNDDLLVRGYGLLPRLGGRLRWWVGKLVMLGVLATLYTAICFAAILAGAVLRLPATLTINHEALGLSASVQELPFVIQVFVLVNSTLIGLAVLQWFLSIIWHSSSQGFIAVMGLLMFSLFSGMQGFIAVRWLPGTQSALFWHNCFDVGVADFSISWSIGYNVTLVVALVTVSTWTMSRLDIVSHRTHT